MFNCVRKIKCHRVWLLFDSVLHFNFARFIRCVRIPQIVPVVTVIIIVEKSCIYGIHGIQTLLTWENTHFPFCFTFFFIFNQNFHVEYTITISNRVSVYYYDTYIIAKPLCYHCISQKIGLSLFLGVFFFSFHFYLFRSFFLNSFPSFFFFLN